MKMMLIRRCLLLLLLYTGIKCNAQDLFSFERSLDYSWYLINQGKHKEADDELDRINAVFGQSDTVNYIRLSHAYMANKSRFFELSRMLLNNSTPLYISHMVLNRAFLSDSIQLVDEICRILLLPPSDKLIITFHTSLYRCDTLKAKQLIMQSGAIAGCYAWEELYNKTVSVPSKRYGPAIALSTVVPGSGKIYAGQSFDGIIAFIVTGLFSFQAYSGFSQAGISSAYGWVYAGASGAFYAGNIYGSYYAVKRYNKISLHKLRNELKASFNCHIN